MVLEDEVMDTSPAPDVFAGIEKLRGRENYSVWKFQMKNLLIHEDLWFAIAGYPEGDATEEATRVRNDQKALSKINLTLRTSCLPHTMRAQTALEAWCSLENVYEDRGRVNLLQKLLSMQKEDHMSVEEYINEVTLISEQIAQTGKPVDEEILSVILLKGFPNNDTFKALILSLEDSGASLTSDIVKHWLMMCYNDAIEQLDETEETEETVNTDGVQKKRGFFRWFQRASTQVEDAFTDGLLKPEAVKNVPHQNGKGKQVVCFKCGQSGHNSNQCVSNTMNDATTSTTTDAAAMGPANNSETSVPKKIGKAIIETAAETVLIRGAVAVGGAVGGAMATAVTVGAKALKRK